MDNSNEPGRPPEDEDRREKTEGESDSVWDLPIPDGVPDSLLESFQDPGASGVDSVGDLEQNRFPDPSPPSEEWLAAQDFSDDLPQEGWEEQNSAAFSEMDDLSGEDDTPGFEPHPDDLAIEPCKWGLLHNLVVTVYRAPHRRGFTKRWLHRKRKGKLKGIEEINRRLQLERKAS